MDAGNVGARRQPVMQYSFLSELRNAMRGTGLTLALVAITTVAIASLQLETGLTHKQTPAERSGLGPRSLGPDEAEHPSPAIRQQRELGEALRQSLDQLGGRIGSANS